jgi:zinc/manganese transport system permease protein
MMYSIFIQPFVDDLAMHNALLGVVLMAVGAAPVGVFLMLRRMSLTGDALSHAILPGVAMGYLAFGLQILPMTIGGMIAGLIVVIGAGAVSRFTRHNEDASMAAFYLISLAAGVLLVTLRGQSDELIHLLFGSVETLSGNALWLTGGISLVTVMVLAVLWRGLIAECLDPLFLRSVSGIGAVVHFSFLVLVVLNLVNGYQALGTLLSVGLMMLPAVSARFWAHRVVTICVVAIGTGVLSGIAGLLIAHHFAVPSGPCIILVAGVVYIASIVIGTNGIIRTQLKPHRHRVG